MKFTAILVLVTLTGLAAAAAEPQAFDGAALLKLVDDAQHGRIELCHDPRWPAWRFEEGEAGRARLSALKKLADAAWSKRRDDTSGDAFSEAREIARLSALSNVLDAATAAPDRPTWNATFANAARFIDASRVKAHAITSDDFPAIVARRGIWRLAHARTYARPPLSEVFRGIGGCLIATHHVIAEEVVARRTIATLDRGWPTDASDGRGAESTAIDVMSTRAGYRYISTHWRRLTENAKRGRLPRGALPLWRINFFEDPHPTPAGPAYLARFESEWSDIEELLRTASPTSSVGEELFRLTWLEQFGRLSMVRTKGDAVSEIWKRVEAQDIANTARVKKLLLSRTWFDDEIDGDGAELYGWLIVQHSDLDPDFQRDVLRRLEPLLAQGSVKTQDYALLWDRVAVADKRQQRYGTQTTCENGARVAIGGVEDPPTLDERRKRMGLAPWKQYIELLDKRGGKCER